MSSTLKLIFLAHLLASAPISSASSPFSISPCRELRIKYERHFTDPESGELNPEYRRMFPADYQVEPGLSLVPEAIVSRYGLRHLWGRPLPAAALENLGREWAQIAERLRPNEVKGLYSLKPSRLGFQEQALGKIQEARMQGSNTIRKGGIESASEKAWREADAYVRQRASEEKSLSSMIS